MFILVFIFIFIFICMFLFLFLFIFIFISIGGGGGGGRHAAVTAALQPRPPPVSQESSVSVVARLHEGFKWRTKLDYASKWPERDERGKESKKRRKD